MSAAATLRISRVYETRVLDLRVDTVQHGDVPSVERKIVEHPGSVVIVPFTDSLPQDVDEDVTVDERPLSEVPDLIRSGEIRDAKSIAALLMTLHLFDALPAARSA